MPSVESLQQAPAARGRGGAPLVILIFTVFLDLLGFGIVIPFLPMYAARLGVGAAGVGLILSSYSLMQFICAPFLGRLSDHIGRRPVIMIGLLGSSIGYLIYGFATSFLWLLISRAVHGACAATISTAQAYVADTTTEEKRARGMGMIGAAFGLGFVLGPALGGLLGHASLRTPAFFAAALTFANLIFAALRLPESHPPDPTIRISWRHFAEPVIALPHELTRHRLSRLFSIAFLGTLALAAFETTFSLMAARVYGYTAAGIGGLFAYAGVTQAIAQGYLTGRLVDRAGEAAVMRAGLILFATGIAPIASFGSSVPLLVALALLSLGYGLASPTISSLISRRATRDEQGEVLGVNQSALSLARIFGPLAGGFIYQMWGPAPAYVWGGLVAIVALALTRGIDRDA